MVLMRRSIVRVKTGNVQMKRICLAALAAMASVQARAGVVGIKFSGGGVSGTVVLAYGSATDMTYPGKGFEITAVGGTFSDTNPGSALSTRR
jgi:hypothetical protein